MLDQPAGTIAQAEEGTDHLTDIEFAVFANGVLDLLPGEFTATSSAKGADYMV